jgi:peptidoglycan/LPS O-acetylase OafA/YrhL
LEIDSDSFSIARFYQRRVIRIFPALIVVILFCLLVGFILLTPSDYGNLGKSVIATSLFVSNIFFWQQTNYFATPVTQSPLLHTWSLSIEEQFYVCYPWALLFLSRFCPRGRNLTVTIACLLSFAACAVLVYIKPSAAFYLGPTRAWELFLGCLIALEIVSGTDHKLLNQIAAVVGLAFVVIPIFLYSTNTRFPGFAAVPPVIGTGLLIWSGSATPTFIHRLLAVRPTVAIGKASYSLYLWHFPILAFAGYARQGPLGSFAAGALCLLSVAVSFLSLRIIERPFRFPSKNIGARRVVSFALAGTSTMVVAAALIVGPGGYPFRMTTTAAEFLSVEQERDTYHHWECMSLEQKIVPPTQACRLGTKSVEPNTLLWGDSHSVITASALEQSALRNGAAFLFTASVDCPIGIGFSIDAGTGPSFVSTPGYQYCGQYNEVMLKLATENPNIEAVVLSSRWTNWRVGEVGSSAESPVDIRLRDDTGVARSLADNRAIFAKGFESLVRLLTAAGKIIWIIGPLPEPSVRVPKALYIKQLGFDSRDLDIPRASFFAKNKYILAFFQEIAQKYPVKFIWPHTVLCDEQICPVVENGRPLFFDSNHLSAFGATKTSTLYDVIFSSHKLTNVGGTP